MAAAQAEAGGSRVPALRGQGAFKIAVSSAGGFTRGLSPPDLDDNASLFLFQQDTPTFVPPILSKTFGFCFLNWSATDEPTINCFLPTHALFLFTDLFFNLPDC